MTADVRSDDHQFHRAKHGPFHAVFDIAGLASEVEQLDRRIIEMRSLSRILSTIDAGVRTLEMGAFGDRAAG